nr:integrase, catalytic region, zinc finger, CCHC-type, peptidase aspartic, catalytic [Tanacetum cinerariifolium]
MTTLAEFMILSRGDNRPPILDKDMYDSWQSRMELYMGNREHGRMILESVKNGLLIWSTIEENGSGIAEGSVTQTVITNNATYQADDLDAYDLNLDDITTAKVALKANLSRYGSDVLYEDINSSAQQDAMILSVFEQLSNQVTNCNKVNKDNLIANESLSTELERYKERVKLLEERQNVDLESLTTTFNVLKNESKENEAKNIDKEISLEKKVKELDNIVYKLGQSIQTMHILTKPQVFYDNKLKQALGFQNPSYLKKAQQIRLMLYDGNVIAKETNVISIDDSKETLMPEEENFRKRFVPQQELSTEQAFWFQMSNPSNESSNPSPVKVDIPSELHKEKVCHNNIKNDLRKLKGKDTVDNATQVPDATTIAPGMYKLDPVILAPRDKKNRETQIYYLKHTIEQAAILREIVKQAKSLNPLDSASYTDCSSSKAKIVESSIADNSEPNHSWGSNATDIPSSSSLVNDRYCSLFGNDQFAKIMGYGDYQIGNVIILRVYYVEGLGYNLFSIGQFCDSD